MNMHSVAEQSEAMLALYKQRSRVELFGEMLLKRLRDEPPVSSETFLHFARDLQEELHL